MKLVQKVSIRDLDVQGQTPQGLHLLTGYCGDGFFFTHYRSRDSEFPVF